MPLTEPNDVPLLPTPPSSANPANFDARADAFLDALPAWGSAVDAVGQAAHANAEHAQQQAQSATDSAAEALSSEEAASSSQQAAATSAQSAQGSAQAAATSAQSAQAAATQAQDSQAAAAASQAAAAASAAEAASIVTTGVIDDSQTSATRAWSSQKTRAEIDAKEALPSGGTATDVLTGNRAWTPAVNFINQRLAEIGIGGTVLGITDCNAAPAINGFSFMGDGMANAPGAGWWIIRQEVYNADYLTQHASPVSGRQALYVRHKDNGSWGRWRNVDTRMDSGVVNDTGMHMYGDSKAALNKINRWTYAGAIFKNAPIADADGDWFGIYVDNGRTDNQIFGNASNTLHGLSESQWMTLDLPSPRYYRFVYIAALNDWRLM